MAKPVIHIEVEGQSSAVLNDRLLSLTATDETGTKSDRLELIFDNRAPFLKPPAKGVRVMAALGWKEAVPLGTYTVDSIGAAPGIVSISAKAVSMRGLMKAPKTRSWVNRTLGEIVSTLASEHGFVPAIADDIAAERIPHLSQMAESDLALFNRLASERGLVGKPKGGKLLMYRRGEQSNALHAAPVEIEASELGDWRWKNEDRPAYRSVRAWWRDGDAGERKLVTLGEGAPSSEIPDTYATETKARAAARSRLERSRRKAGVLSGCKLPIGNPRIRAEGRAWVRGMPSVPDVLWTPEKVIHKASKEGFTTDFNAERALEG